VFGKVKERLEQIWEIKENVMDNETKGEESSSEYLRAKWMKRAKHKQRKQEFPTFNAPTNLSIQLDRKMQKLRRRRSIPP